MIRMTLTCLAFCVPVVILYTLLRGWEGGLWMAGLLTFFSVQAGVFMSDGWRVGEEHVWTFADRHAWFGGPFKLLLGGVIVVGFIYCGDILWGLSGKIAAIVKAQAYL